jgi:hypothetical protein
MEFLDDLRVKRAGLTKSFDIIMEILIYLFILIKYSFTREILIEQLRLQTPRPGQKKILPYSDGCFYPFSPSSKKIDL